jgi:aryl-alcohol dehydrogenase-like predicted oxidoreductase
MPIPIRALGTNGPNVPAMGIGLMSLAHFYGSAGDDDARLAFLSSVYDLGAIFWDDADIYGDTEQLVGKWLTANPTKRKDIFLTTKFGFAGMDDQGGFVIRSDPEWVRMACESSLSKLKTEYIDLYYCHRVDGKTPVEETVKTMVELKK